MRNRLLAGAARRSGRLGLAAWRVASRCQVSLCVASLGALALGGCDTGLSPCARTSTSGAQPGHAVELWIDCKDEQAGQLTEVRVKGRAARPLTDAGADASDDFTDWWWVQNPVNDATDYFFVEYGVVPRGWDERLAPQPLSSGQRYRAALTTSDYGTLEFEFVAP